jgi:hypothetical protein
MAPPIHPVLFAALLFFGMLFMLEVGRRFAIRHHAAGESDKSSLGTVETAVFALFGLLIAFTFSGAATRFQEKRMLIAEEASAIESAWLRIDLVAPEAQPGLRGLLRLYVDTRLAIYRLLPDMKAAGPDLAKLDRVRDQIWTTAVAAARLPGSDASGSRLLLRAINDVFRVTRVRMTSLQNHPPPVVYFLLFVLGLLCSLLAGFRMASRFRRSWLHMVSFALVTSGVVYITMDIEYPRVGLIRLDRADEVLGELRDSMQ